VNANPAPSSELLAMFACTEIPPGKLTWQEWQMWKDVTPILPHFNYLIVSKTIEQRPDFSLLWLGIEKLYSRRLLSFFRLTLQWSANPVS
jgi:hypothetical protein